MYVSQHTVSVFDRVASIAERAIDGDTVEQFQRNALETAGRSFGADACCFVVNRGSSWNPDYSRTVSLGLDPGFWGEYLSFSPEHNPVDRWLSDHVLTPRARAATIDRVVPFGVLRRTKFYQQVMQPRAQRYTLGMTLVAGQRPVGAVAFIRSFAHGPFTDDELVVARLLNHLLAGTLDSCLAREHLMAREVALRVLETQQPDAAVVVADDCLRVIYANAAAVGTFSELYRGSLPPEVAAACRRHCMAHGPHGPAGETEIPIVPPGGGERCKLLLKLAPLPAVPGRDNWLLLRFTTQVAEARLAGCAHAYGLTSREREIVRYLCAGLRNVEIAAKLGITARTVENHLRTIYRKIGVHNRARVIYQLSQPKPQLI